LSNNIGKIALGGLAWLIAYMYRNSEVRYPEGKSPLAHPVQPDEASACRIGAGRRL
jgi:hypothetical protein